MKRWIEGLAQFQDPESHVDKLAHHGTDNDHGRLAGGCQTISEDTPHAVFVIVTIAGMYRALCKAA